jgi:2',3'-cyclic-nucleotide 2'-phosphodiesterase (5'-nucleotidase family)
MNRVGILFFLLLLGVAAGTFVKVAVVGTNDIHGSALPTLLHRADLNQNYTYGGL